MEIGVACGGCGMGSRNRRQLRATTRAAGGETFACGLGFCGSRSEAANMQQSSEGQQIWAAQKNYHGLQIHYMLEHCFGLKIVAF